MSTEVAERKPVELPSAALATATPYASGKYAFISTLQVVETLAQQGWQPESASQLRVRDPQRDGYQKHMIRFRRESDKSLLKKDELYPEIVYIGGHDLRERAELHAGLLRLVCLNGLMVADSLFESIKVVHTANAVAFLMDAISRIGDAFPKVVGRINTYRQIELVKDEQGIFAEAAATLRWPDTKTREGLDLDGLLKPLRRRDEAPTLWNTLNTLQEKLVEKGGVAFNRQKYSRTSKGITSINENRRVNMGLWAVAEQLAKFKLGEIPAEAVMSDN